MSPVLMSAERADSSISRSRSVDSSTNGARARLVRAAGATLSTLLIALLAACGSDAPSAPVTPPPPPPPPAEVRTVEIAGVPQTGLVTGARVRLSATPRDAAGQPVARAVAWSSSDLSVLTIDATGDLLAVSPGTATIFAAADGVRASVAIRVDTPEPPPPPPPAPIARLALSTNALDLEVRENAVLTVRAFDAEGNELFGRAVQFTSSDARVVTASPQGTVYGVATGSATVEARANGVVATASVRVLPRPAFELIYDRVAPSGNEIFTLAFDGSAPVRLNAGNVSRQPSVSPDGRRVVFAVSQRDLLTGALQHDLYVVDRNGLNMRRLTSMPGVETSPVWSPDGTRIAFAASSAINDAYDLWVIDVDGNNARNLTDGMPWSYEDDPAWSPDSRTIAFTSLGLIGGATLHTVPADGSSAPTPIAIGGADAHTTSVIGVSWSPDGARLALSLQFTDGDRDIAIIARNGGAVQRVRAIGPQLDPAWSPDGEFFAYTTDRAAGARIGTMRIDGSSARLREDGRNPAWIAR